MIPCVKCGRTFADLQALRQHSHHSHRCRAKHHRTTRDFEMLIKTKMGRSPETLIADLRKALENVGVLAHTFGPDGKVKPTERAMFALAALKTIENLVTHALIGV